MEATLVQGVEATLIVEEEPASTNAQDRGTVYEATIVPPEQPPLVNDSSSVDESRLDENLPWWKQHQKYILAALAMIVIAIVAILSGVLIKPSKLLKRMKSR